MVYGSSSVQSHPRYECVQMPYEAVVPAYSHFVPAGLHRLEMGRNQRMLMGMHSRQQMVHERAPGED